MTTQDDDDKQLLQQRSFRTTRTLPFSPAQVYAAFESPEQLARWWGPEGFSNRFEAFDFRPGGRWVFDMIGPDGKDYRNENLFVELVPSRRIVIRHDCAPYFTLTVSLDPAGDGAAHTRLDWEQVFDDAATAQAVRHIVEPANEQNIDRLERVLAAPN